ncbi:MAG: HD domain-containing protein [Chloroflexi bacterium]|nr:HD domain-containing protein [Chloroflexota bacterium]
MTRDEFIYLFPYFGSLAISFSVLAYTWSRRNAQGALAFAWYGLGQVLWISGFILEMVSRDIHSKIFWDGFQWFAGFLIIVSLPVFAVEYTGYKLPRANLLFRLSLIVPGLFAICLLSDQSIHLVYANVHLTNAVPFRELIYEYTVAVLVYAFYNYAIAIWSIYTIIRQATRPHKLYQSQAILITLGFLIPIIGTVFTLLNIPLAPQRDAAPLSAAVGNLFVVWGLFRFRIFNIVPIPRDKVFEGMVEPVVILDNQNIIVDVNLSMLALLGKSSTDVIGASAKTIFANFPIPIKLYTDVSYARADATFELGGLTIHYELTVWPLYNSNKEIMGRVYISHDVTAMKELEKDLRKLNSELEDRVRARTWELAEAYDTTLEGWARALELRDKETEGHSRRVTENTLKIAIAMGINGDYLEHIRRGAILHDIGKMSIPDEILHKPDKLTDVEREIIRQHPTTAYNLLAPIPFLKKAMEIPYSHHEKWDGTGYPQGLKEHAIPMSARIFAVADVWDALVSNRSYNEAWPREKIIDYFVKQAGVHFDPRVVNIFLELVERGEI